MTETALEISPARQAVMDRPRLLVICDKFAPDRGGAGAVYSEMCYELAARQFDVTVYAPVPFYPEWQDKSGRNGLRFWRYSERGVDIVRYGLFIPRNPRSLFQRLAFELSILLSLMRLVARGGRFDAVMVYCPWFGALVFASVMKTFFRRPLWLNVQDIPAGAAAAAGIARSGLVTRLFSAIQKHYYNRADIWSSISSVMIDKLRPLRSRAQPIIFLPNWADSGFLAEIKGRRRDRRQAGQPPRLLYAGNIGGKQNLLEFCRFLHATDAAFEFRIFGNGGRAQELQKWVAEAADPRFSFGPFLSASDLADQLMWCDLHVITERSDSDNSFFPSKLVTAMASGAPTLAICDATSPLGVEMGIAGPGIRFGWDELDQVPGLVGRLRDEPEIAAEWRSRALGRARFYDRRVIVDRLADLLRTVAKRQDVLPDAAEGDAAS